MLRRRAMTTETHHRVRAPRPRSMRPVPLRSAWDRAIADFCTAWDLSHAERVILALDRKSVV